MKIKIINIFIIFCFIIPFCISMYINVSTAFATTKLRQISEVPSSMPDDITSKATIIPESPISTPDIENSVIKIKDEDIACGNANTELPEILSDNSVIVKVFDRTANEVIEMTLHDYVICAVAGEMPATFELEALKAQAVAARTFTVSHLNSACSGNYSAHVCTYYGCCQAYVSVEKMKKNWGSQFEEKYAKIKAAVEQTDSLVMLYNNLPITVFYFSTSNGYTEACQDVFVKNLPYYKSVESPKEESASAYYSYVKLSYDEFAETLSSKFNITVAKEDLEESISITRTDGGRVGAIAFNGQSVKGTKMRTAFGLRSTDFHITFFDDYILIEVYGNGHGVGMSQLGANYMAQNKNTFTDILNHYYIDVEIKPYNK